MTRKEPLRRGGGSRGSPPREPQSEPLLPGRLTMISGELCRGDGGRVPGTVVIDGATIVEIAYGSHISDPTARRYEIENGLIIPGLIDLHVHGGGGHSAFGCTSQLRAVGAWLAARGGVTGFLASVPALPWPDLLRACETVARACACGDPPNLLGIHLEGPHLSPRRSGSQPAANLRPPSLRDYLALRAVAGESLKLLTIAPELPGAREIIEACRRDGVIAALGHSDADYEQAAAGFAAGITHVTHLFNAMKPFHHRAPGSVGAALTDPVAVAELILDGEHVHRGSWELARRTLGPERICLVSDALPIAGLDSQSGDWAGLRVARRGRRLTLDDGTLAGSDICLLEAVQRAVAWNAPWPEAVAAASAVPARVLGLASVTGRLAPGMRGDLCVIGRDGRPALTLVGGRPWPVDPAAASSRRSTS